MNQGWSNKYCSICPNTLFFHCDIFQVSLFKQAAVRLSFLPCNVGHSKQATVVFIPTLLFRAISVLSCSKRSDLFVDRFLYLPFLYEVPCCYQ